MEMNGEKKVVLRETSLDNEKLFISMVTEVAKTVVV